jgi:hypothetical protein
VRVRVGVGGDLGALEAQLLHTDPHPPRHAAAAVPIAPADTQPTAHASAGSKSMATVRCGVGGGGGAGETCVIGAHDYSPDM